LSLTTEERTFQAILSRFYSLLRAEKFSEIYITLHIIIIIIIIIIIVVVVVVVVVVIVIIVINILIVIFFLLFLPRGPQGSLDY